MANRHQLIRDNLDYLQNKGVIRGWTAQGQMPGKRWTLWGDFSTGRAYTTAEVEVFITGANAGVRATG